MSPVEGNTTDPRQLVLDYDTRGWPRGRAFEFDREVLRTTYDLLRPAGSEADHWFKSRVRLVGNLMLAQNEVGGGHTLVRGQEHVESNLGAYLKVQLFSKPEGSLLSTGGLVALDPGSVFVIDQSRPYRQTMPGGQNLTLFLPHARMNNDPRMLPPILRLGRETTEGRFLAYSMRMIFRLLKAGSAENATGLSQALCGSISALLECQMQQNDRPTASAARRFDAARRLIDLNLADPEFGPEDVLERVAASRATLYRDFASVGGLMAYIQARRMERAYQTLSMSPDRRGSVRDVAESSGFTSMAIFSRSFRKLYGCSPSDILGQWRMRPDQEAEGEDRLISPRTDALRAAYSWPSAKATTARAPSHGTAKIQAADVLTASEARSGQCDPD